MTRVFVADSLKVIGADVEDPKTGRKRRIMYVVLEGGEVVGAQVLIPMDEKAAQQLHDAVCDFEFTDIDNEVKVKGKAKLH